MCLVLSGAAEPIISVVYGAEWTPAAAALTGSALFAGLRILYELFYDYFVVLGSTRVVFTVQLVWFIGLVPALYAGAKLGGIAGAAGANRAVAVAVVLPLLPGGTASRRDRLACHWPRASPFRWHAEPAWPSCRLPRTG